MGTNLRFRTKVEMVQDLEVALNTNLSYGTKYAVVEDISWKWTEYQGKYKGCQYWSEGALTKFKSLDKDDLKNCEKFFRHEHVVPKNLIIHYLLTEKNVKIEELLNKVLVGAVVTKEEEQQLLKSTMPERVENVKIENYTLEDIWARYKDASIKVYKVEWEEGRSKKIISEELLIMPNKPKVSQKRRAKTT